MTNTTQGAAEPLTITITRWQSVGRPGSRPSIRYGYITPVEIRTPLGGLPVQAHVVRAGQEFVAGDSYLDDIRSRLRRKFGPKTTFLKSWEPATCTRCRARMTFRVDATSGDTIQACRWVAVNAPAGPCGEAGQAHVPSQGKAAR